MAQKLTFFVGRESNKSRRPKDPRRHLAHGLVRRKTQCWSKPCLLIYTRPQFLRGIFWSTKKTTCPCKVEIKMPRAYMFDKGSKRKADATQSIFDFTVELGLWRPHCELGADTFGHRENHSRAHTFPMSAWRGRNDDSTGRPLVCNDKWPSLE